MAFGDKLKFWKKDDDMGLDDDPFAQPNNQGGQNPFGSQQAPGQNQFGPPQQNDPFGQTNDPMGTQGLQDPFASQAPNSFGGDPFSQQNQAQDPFAGQQSADPFGGQQQNDQFSQPQQPMPSAPFGGQESHPQQFGQPFAPSEQRYQQPELVRNDTSNEHSTELILTRLDILKAMLEGINQRLANLERKQSNDNKW